MYQRRGGSSHAMDHHHRSRARGRPHVAETTAERRGPHQTGPALHERRAADPRRRGRHGGPAGPGRLHRRGAVLDRRQRRRLRPVLLAGLGRTGRTTGCTPVPMPPRPSSGPGTAGRSSRSCPWSAGTGREPCPRPCLVQKRPSPGRGCGSSGRGAPAEGRPPTPDSVGRAPNHRRRCMAVELGPIRVLDGAPAVSAGGRIGS